MQNYEQVRSQLLEMLQELDGRLTKITADVRHEDAPLSHDFEEQAVELQNNEVLDAIGNNTRAEIQKIRQAIDTIDKGEYGMCQVCGAEIAAERLVAVPFSCMCIKCATAAEGC